MTVTLTNVRSAVCVVPQWLLTQPNCAQCWLHIHYRPKRISALRCWLFQACVLGLVINLELPNSWPAVRVGGTMVDCKVSFVACRSFSQGAEQGSGNSWMRGESDLSKCDSAKSESPNNVPYNGSLIPGSVSTLSGVPCFFLPLSFQNLREGSERVSRQLSVSTCIDWEWNMAQYVYSWAVLKYSFDTSTPLQSTTRCERVWYFVNMLI